MTIPANLRQTEENREDNPKAVFFGELPDFSRPIIQYLNERRVELFTAKDWDEIFFGDYFIYIGDLNRVKTFLESGTKNLPRSLLMITDTSDTAKTKELLKQYPKLKICLFEKDKSLTKTQVDDLFAFYLGGSDQILNLRTTSIAPTETPAEEKEMVSEEKPTEENSKADEITLTLSQPHTQRSEPEVTKVPEKKPDQKQERPSRPKSRLLPVALIILFLFFVLPIFSTLVFGAVGTYELRRIDNDFNKNQIASVQRRADLASFSFSNAGRSLGFLEPVFTVTRQNEIYQSGQKLLSLGKSVSSAYNYLARTTIPADTLVKTVMGKEKTTAVTGLISDIKNNLELADDEIAQAQATFKSAALSNVLQKLPNSWDNELKDRLQQGRNQVQTAKGLVTLAPELLGIYVPRTFLIVFQNNMEARPTGGFIGSYGLLNLDSGVLKNVTVNDIYAADGQLLGHVDPPEPVRVYLNQEHWYMRDSNWDPNFADSARQLLWFLEKETGVTADGVIAADVYLAQDVLEILGPIELTDYQLTLDKDNLFTTLHSEIESDFFPGSTKKADYLGSLFRTILEKLQSEDLALNLNFVKKLQTAANQKNLQFYFSNPKTQGVIDESDWSNELPPDDPCLDNTCVYDYVAAIDANLGANKVNVQVERHVQSRLEMDIAGKLTQNLSLNYKNSSTTDDKTQGDYKNYLRVYLPNDYEIEKVSINDIPLTLDSEILSASESTARISLEKRSRAVDIYLTVPKQGERTVTITAVRQLNPANNFKYIYELVKQPGYKAEKTGLVFNLAPQFTLTNNSALGQVAGATTLVSGNQITYNTSLVQDETIELNLIKN